MAKLIKVLLLLLVASALLFVPSGGGCSFGYGAQVGDSIYSGQVVFQKTQPLPHGVLKHGDIQQP
jgi:hypothetical protein